MSRIALQEQVTGMRQAVDVCDCSARVLLRAGTHRVEASLVCVAVPSREAVQFRQGSQP